MVKGLYTGYTGMVNSQKRLDVISNNLANATTTGFKAEGCTTQAFDSMYAIKINKHNVFQRWRISDEFRRLSCDKRRRLYFR